MPQLPEFVAYKVAQYESGGCVTEFGQTLTLLTIFMNISKRLYQQRLRFQTQPITSTYRIVLRNGPESIVYLRWSFKFHGLPQIFVTSGDSEEISRVIPSVRALMDWATEEGVATQLNKSARAMTGNIINNDRFFGNHKKGFILHARHDEFVTKALFEIANASDPITATQRQELKRVLQETFRDVSPVLKRCLDRQERKGSLIQSSDLARTQIWNEEASRRAYVTRRKRAADAAKRRREFEGDSARVTL